ncbi:UPF0149 family protein [Sphingomonas albertensis]|uniref:UPF0149 family protein n=1 Tax=Sphingomonas albertensis TaxID=2762591 RepID=A0ABR7AM83_9SPHN|nr:UPF0149 family protein [Sphingomonas albertensis]MBC3941565.1 UPF0149 family protein [Sphingomonas albertensis]
MKQLASRLRRLDDALADLPLEEPMLLTELDGFLTGISVCPEAILPAEWLQGVWGSDDSGVAPFDDPLDVQWFADAVMARHAEIVRDLARGKLRPIFDVDERNGDVLWELWVDGFAEAMALRPDGWDAVANGDDRDAAAALESLSRLIAIARNESPLDSMEINAFEDRATTDLVDGVQRLHTARSRRQPDSPAQTIGATSAKIGRNDPCPCGSGKKSKRCCG